MKGEIIGHMAEANEKIDEILFVSPMYSSAKAKYAGHMAEKPMPGSFEKFY